MQNRAAGAFRTRTGIGPGVLSPGPLNAITDVAGVLVGHVTVVQELDIRTGATAILPHGGNVFQHRVPAALHVANGFGKLLGATQIMELGEIETPIVLTNTLAVPRAADALLDHVLAQPGNEKVVSVNPVVGETNDGHLNDIRARVLTAATIAESLRAGKTGPLEEGSVGAGTGTVCFGWKGGIGSSSRRLPTGLGGYTVGVLVQTNFGGVLQIMGVPVGQLLGRYYLRRELEPGAGDPSPDGSIMMIVATDAPLDSRNLTRLAARAVIGLGRTGASMSNGSGDYAIAFSTAESVRRTPERRGAVASIENLPNDLLSPLFQATIEATEEAIYSSLFAATSVTGYLGRTVEALPVEKVVALLKSRGVM